MRKLFNETLDREKSTFLMMNWNEVHVVPVLALQVFYNIQFFVYFGNCAIFHNLGNMPAYSKALFLQSPDKNLNMGCQCQEYCLPISLKWTKENNFIEILLIIRK